MTFESDDILERVDRDYHFQMDLTIRKEYLNLLHAIGNPQEHLQTVIHVAGTNGKGSTCAFLRAIVEASGHTTNVYTSPHLVRFHERIRVRGQEISEDSLVNILRRVESASKPRTVSHFEFSTAAAFLTFAENPADVTIIEVGLGGRLDATNVISKPASTAISRISFDHRQQLGDTLSRIASEKAGIIKSGVGCALMQQPDKSVTTTIERVAKEYGANLYLGGRDWSRQINQDGRWSYRGKQIFDLPPPSLPGRHQYDNAALAIAALELAGVPVQRQTASIGLQTITWRARLQQLSKGATVNILPTGSELWLDGGHNDSAGEVLAAHAQTWSADKKQLHLIVGMVGNRDPSELLKPLAPFCASLHAVPVPMEKIRHGRTGEEIPPSQVADAAQNLGIPARKAASVDEAVRHICQEPMPARILICGSLFLAGFVLESNS